MVREEDLYEAVVHEILAEHEDGSAVVVRERASEMALIAIRRWGSFARRHRPQDDTPERRIEDLAKGLRDHFEDDPSGIGSGMESYRWLARRLEVVFRRRLELPTPD